MDNFLRFLVERHLLVNLVSVFLVILGLYAMFAINREAFPNVNLDKIQVTVVYPGATPEEVERLVITPVEQELKALDGIDKMISVSFPGSGFITLELDPYASNRDRLTSDVQLAVDRADLPDDLPDDPIVQEIDGSVFPVIRLAVSAPVDELTLKRLGDRIEDDLLNISGVARAVVQAERKSEIRIVVDPEKMQKHRLSVGELARLLSNWNVNAPGGDIDTSEGQKAVRIAGEFSNADDVANLVVLANERGGVTRVRDIATVSESLEKASRYYDVSGKPALSFLVLKKRQADIITTVDEIKHYLETVPAKYGSDVKVSTFEDFSAFARLRLGVLTNNGMVGLVLVFASLILFLRPSVALTTTWGLPIVFLTGLFVLYASGITLNLISMMGFIMVLGMLVDDAIIIGENITYHMEKGMNPVEAAVKGAHELIGPVTATVMTTIVAFLPMLFMSGIIGKFIVAIPTVVISLLFFSWLESFLILPSHVAVVTNRNAHPKERAWLVKLEDTYAKVLEFALDHRRITVALSFLMLFGSLVLAKVVMSFQLFPSVGIDQYLVRVTAQPGISLEHMRDKLIEMDREIRQRIKPEYLEATLISTGQIAIDEGDPLTQRGSRFGQIRVLYHPAVVRPHHDALDDMHKLEKELPKLYPKLEIAFTEKKPGPPTGRALEVEISSTDSEASEAAARNLEAYLKTVPGVTSVESGLTPGDNELHVVMDRTLATYAGVDLATAATHVRAAVDGLRVSTARWGTEEVDITIRFPENGTDEIEMLKNLLIPNQRGGLIPLSRIARLVDRPGFTTISHKAGIRIVNVVANIDTSIITSVEINRLVAQNEKQWLGASPERISVNYGGEEEKNMQSFRDLAIAFGFAMIGIFFILAIQFNKISYPLVVMLAIPFGAIGIVISFFLHDLFWQPTPLSFFSMLGMVALSGVVVNSSLILLVFIQRAREEGMNCRDAIMLAGRRRLRAVLLTATTTVVGLLPTAYGWGGMDRFVSPMALSLSSGLIFATVITLITIPATFAVCVDIREALQKKLLRR
ncbi:MAG: efflux RND transporter permease subunit [Gammaproteobacteria bacterium]|nr:efflux RND transporter permease subunit [Gammaproteobacteria bacterium]